jgi:hypothetical protein
MGGTRSRVRTTSPLRGRVTSSVATIFPSASTVSVVFSPPAPRTPIAASISTVEPASTLGGAETLMTDRSRLNRSWPTPTV